MNKDQFLKMPVCNLGGENRLDSITGKEECLTNVQTRVTGDSINIAWNFLVPSVCQLLPPIFTKKSLNGVPYKLSIIKLIFIRTPEPGWKFLVTHALHTVL